MELSTLARAILFGDRLEDKLTDPRELTDLQPETGLELPLLPGRPPNLRLSVRPRGPGETGAARFPRASELVHPEARGRALHFFANHELLAIELFAWMLLRFPEAPAALRRGVAETLREEQAHLRLYQARMEALGVGFGEVPVSGFFWTALRGAESPAHFLAGMSLTFEQANLDFAHHYAELFAELGDEETRAILEKVYEDEIGHVRHGAAWLARWRGPERDDWESWLSLLEAPLSPARAKGPGFDRAARRRAGLSERFVRELEVYSRSKGRTPRLFWLHPGFEEELVTGRPLPSSRTVARLAADFGFLPAFLAAEDDVLLLAARPSTEHLAGLRRAGFVAPELIERPVDARGEGALAGRRFASLEPWGFGPSALNLARELELSAPPLEVTRRLASKPFSFALRRRYLEQFGGPGLSPVEHTGTLAADPGSVRAILDELSDRGWARAVVKAAHSASGRNRLFLDLARGMEPNAARWTERALAEGPLLVEPWLEKIRDLSLQLFVDPDREDPLLYAGRFYTDGRGRYLGHRLGPPLHGLPPPLRASLARTGFEERLGHLARFVRAQLLEEGHRGPAGIDLCLYRPPGAGDGECLCQPLLEVNPRRTMGHVAAALAGHLAPGAVGAWLHLDRRALEQRGFSSFAGFAQALGSDRPVTLRRVGGGPRLVAGALFTTDPAAAQEICTLLLVGPRLEELGALLGDHAELLPEPT